MASDLDAILTMTNQAESVQDESDSELYYFMNSWVVASDIANDAEGLIEYDFTGTGLSYEYDILFVYGEPDSDDSALVVLSASEAEGDASSSETVSGSDSSHTEVSSSVRNQSLIYITVGVISILVIIWFLL